MLGGLVVALLAKWAPVIRGHGIPEAMEAVLSRESRDRATAAVAKPTSAAVAIGTGGPFGAEGPIIVTGGALGSLIGQALHVSPAERKILLAAGAAAGMAATFGAPLASVVLAIELLLFEFSRRAFVPLVVAASVAARDARVVFGSRPAVPGTAAQLQRARRSFPCSRCSGSLRRCSRSSCARACTWSRRVSAGCTDSLVLASGHRRGCCSRLSDSPFHARSVSATTRSTTCWPTARSRTLARARARQARRVVVRARLRHVRGDAGADPAHRRRVRRPRSARWCTTSLPGIHLAPGAVASSRWPRPSVRRRARPFTAIVFAFELTHDYQGDPSDHAEPRCSRNSWPTCCSSTAS